MSTNIWYPPDTWDVGLVRQTRMNQQIKANMEYLHQKNLAKIEVRDGTNSTATNPLGSITHTTNGGNIALRFKGLCFGSVASTIVFDVEITLGGGGGTLYASTDTATPATFGVVRYRIPAVNYNINAGFFVIATNIPAGTHTYTLTMTTTAGTATLQLADHLTQFIVEDYGQGATNVYQWDAPKSWTSGENLTKGKLDQYVKNRQELLYDKNYVYHKEVLGAVISTTSVSFVNTGLKVELLTEGNDVNLTLLLAMYNSAASTLTYLDVLVDDDYYLSSLNGTPLSDGIYNRTCQINFVRTAFNQYLITDLAAGWHKFEVYYKTSNAAGAAVISSDNTILIMAEEYCLTS